MLTVSVVFQKSCFSVVLLLVGHRAACYGREDGREEVYPGGGTGEGYIAGYSLPGYIPGIASLVLPVTPGSSLKKWQKSRNSSKVATIP